MSANLNDSSSVDSARHERPAPRDVRIDFLRGLALLVICANHIRENRFARLTPVAWGFSDMAEVFVCLSGMVTFISLHRTYSNHGAVAVLVKSCRRCILIYLAYLVTGTFLVWFIRVLGAGHFRTEVADQLLLCSPEQVPWLLATFQYRVSHLTILPLYLAFQLILGLLWTWLARSSRLTLSISLILYLLTQMNPRSFCYPDPWRESVYYNPYAWQFLFVVGGCWTLLGEPFQLRLLQQRWLPFAGCLVLMIWHGASLGGQPGWLVSSKPMLGWTRLLHFLALAAVVAPWMTKVKNRLGLGIPGWISICGRHSLLVYCTGAMISAFATWQRAQLSPGWFTDGIVTTTALCASILVAGLAESRVSTKQDLALNSSKQ